MANSLRLIKLPKAIQDMVIAGDLTAGHARVLAGVEDEKRQLELAHQCVLHGYSVRRLEEAAKEKVKPVSKKAAAALSPELDMLQSSMREALGLKTTLNGNEKKGKIILSYNSAQELEHLYEVIGRLLD